MCTPDHQKEANLYIIELLHTETTGLRNSCLCIIVAERSPEYQAHLLRGETRNCVLKLFHVTETDVFADMCMQSTFSLHFLINISNA